MIIVYVILPLVSYFGRHQDLMKAEAKETPHISAAIITASLKSTPSKIMTTTGPRQEYESKTFRNFDTEANFTMSQMSTVKTQTLEMANTSSKDSRQPSVVLSVRSLLTITSSIRSSSTLETTSPITVSLNPVGGINHPIEPSRAVSPSQYLLSSLLPNSTVNAYGGQVDVKDDCSTDACDTYVTRWVDFYLNVSNNKNKYTALGISCSITLHFNSNFLSF